MTFGQKLKELRVSKNIGIKPLAKKLGISYTYISHLENERKTPSYEFIKKLSKYFKTNEEELKLLSGKLPEDVLNIFYKHPYEAVSVLRERFNTYQPVLINQLNLPTVVEKDISDFPSTRYQGSKLKLINWIWESIKHLKFNTVLDAFGGTGCVSYLFKTKGKIVTYNDILNFNYTIGKALIENKKTLLDKKDVEFILTKHNNFKYKTFITDEFHDIYYTDDENKWLDLVIQNIFRLNNEYKRALAFFALFQACIIKRPYNLFHRKNLYIRFSEVERSFGNKTTWDRSFYEHFIPFINEANNAVFDNGKLTKSINKNVFEIKNSFDLVYIDTPYMNKNGVSVDYFDFYHFLEGIMIYYDWKKMIDLKSKHKRLESQYCIWSDKNKIKEAFVKLFDKFNESILVISYRDDGIPSIRELFNLLKQYKQKVTLLKYGQYKYVLSKNGSSSEVLLIGE